MKNDKSQKAKDSITKILIIFFIVIVVIFVIARYATDEEFRSSININVFKKEVLESTLNSIEIDTDSNPTVYAFDKYIVVFSKNKLIEYTSDGKIAKELDINISVPLITINGKYMAIAEKEGQKMYLVSGENIIWNTNVEGNISGINVNKNGYVSIVIKNTTYKSVIAFYDLSGTELFRTYISSSYATCTSVSTNNQYLAIGSVDYSGTIIKSYVKIISIEKAQKDPENSTIYNYESENGEIITNINYQDKENAICVFNSYVQKIGISSDERLYDITENDLFLDVNLSNSIAIIDKQSSGLFSYEYEVVIKNTNNKSESLYILDSDLPKTMIVSNDNIGLNLGNEVRIINSNGWLLKKYSSNNQIKSLVIGESIAGIIYKNKIELIDL